MVEAKQDLGLSILTSSAVFGAWSAWNSSLFTAATFVTDGEKYRNAKLAMDLGLATALATGLGVYLVYGDKGKVAAASAFLTGIVLYIAYYCKLKSNPVLAATIKKENGSSNKSISGWVPLSSDQIKNIRSITNKNPFSFVAEP